MVISIISLVNLIMTDVVHLSAFLSVMLLPWDSSASFFFLGLGHKFCLHEFCLIHILFYNSLNHMSENPDSVIRNPGNFA